ncbi:unnamed protein product, partial [Sphagnum tenellum]
GNQPSGNFPIKLKNCVCLQTLDLSNQNLTGSIPFSYTSLSNLQSFSLANNYSIGRS